MSFPSLPTLRGSLDFGPIYSWCAAWGILVKVSFSFSFSMGWFCIFSVVSLSSLFSLSLWILGIPHLSHDNKFSFEVLRLLNLRKFFIYND